MRNASLKLKDEDGYAIGVVDHYHLPVVRRRQRLCRCLHEVPCFGFTCVGPTHRGSRLTPWCRGATTDLRDVHFIADQANKLGYNRAAVDCDLCDDCWSKRRSKETAECRSR